MNISLSVLSITAALSMGAISPGPSFVLVARTAVAMSRKNGIATALGLGIGCAIFALAAMLGLHTLFKAVPWAYMAFKLVGGLYLFYLACKIWRGANQPVLIVDSVVTPQAKSLQRSCLLGLVTQLSNPKTVIVFSSVFAALLPKDVPIALYFILPVIAFMIDLIWYTLVTYALSSATSRITYLRYKAWIDRVAGGVMALLGIKLLTLVKL